MGKVSILSMQRRRNRQRKKEHDTTAAQASRLTHSIMNELTIVHLSCAKLRRSLDSPRRRDEDSDIEIIELAADKIAVQVEALRFRLEKATGTRPQPPFKEPPKPLRPKSKLSPIPAREISKT